MTYIYVVISWKDNLHFPQNYSYRFQNMDLHFKKIAFYYKHDILYINSTATFKLNFVFMYLVFS